MQDDNAPEQRPRESAKTPDELHEQALRIFASVRSYTARQQRKSYANDRDRFKGYAGRNGRH